MLKKIISIFIICIITAFLLPFETYAAHYDYEIYDSCVVAHITGIEASKKTEDIKVIIDSSTNIVDVNSNSASEIITAGTQVSVLYSNITGEDISDITVIFERNTDVEFIVSIHYYYNGNIYDTETFSDIVYLNGENRPPVTTSITTVPTTITTTTAQDSETTTQVKETTKAMTSKLTETVTSEITTIKSSKKTTVSSTQQTTTYITACVTDSFQTTESANYSVMQENNSRYKKDLLILLIVLIIFLLGLMIVVIIAAVSSIRKIAFSTDNCQDETEDYEQEHDIK